MTTDVVVETSISAFSQQDWDRCFSDEPENWEFYKVCEQSGPPGFQWYFAAVVEDGRIIAVAPAFGTIYRLDTTVQGRLKRVTERLFQVMPALMSLRLLALGSPVAEICHLGFAPEVPGHRRSSLLDELLSSLRSFGLLHGYRLFGIKDAPACDAQVWNAAMEKQRFTRLPGMPTAVIDLPHSTFDDYLGSLSRATRKDMRRKMKTFAEIRIERRHHVDDVADRIAALYQQTMGRSDLQFENLPQSYFVEFVRRLSPWASMFLYWAEDELIAFNLVIEDQHRLIDKYIGMDYAVVHKYNLYFNTWLTNVRYCVERGIPTYQCGQAFYETKIRLGCRLLPNWMYFRHASVLLNGVLQVVARVVRLDRFDPAIADLVADRP